MPRPCERRTYRLRRLPLYLQRQDVVEFLCWASSSFGLEGNIEVSSLASNLIVWRNPLTRTATLVSKRTPKPLDDDEVEWTVSAHHTGWNRNLIFDVHFEGFTPLNDVDSSIHLAE